MSNLEELSEEINNFMKTIFTKDLSHLLASWLFQFYSDLKQAGFSDEQALALCKLPELKK